MTSSGKSLKERAYRMLKEFFAITVYLWVVFGLLILYKSAILAKYDVDLVQHGLALINALALAKVMLVAKDLHLGQRYERHSLVYVVLVKSALFTAVLALFKLLEDYVVGLFHHKTFQESIGDLAGGTGKGMATLTALLFVILIPLVAYIELKRVLGEDKVAELMYSPHTVNEVQPNQAA